MTFTHPHPLETLKEVQSYPLSLQPFMCLNPLRIIGNLYLVQVNHQGQLEGSNNALQHYLLRKMSNPQHLLLNQMSPNNLWTSGHLPQS